MSGDPTETAADTPAEEARGIICRTLEDPPAGSMWLAQGGWMADFILEALTAAGFAVVRADLPHGTELRKEGEVRFDPTYPGAAFDDGAYRDVYVNVAPSGREVSS